MTNARGPAYRVETERLVMRCWSPADAPRLRRALDEADAHLRPWIPWMSEEPRTLEQTAQRLRRERAEFDRDETYRYAIFTRDEATLLGSTGLFTRVGPRARETGYWLHPDHCGKGYASEVTMAMTKIAFDVDGVDRVELRCQPDNAPSNRVPERLGFVHEATLRRAGLDSEGRLVDLQVWMLFADRYRDTPSARIAL
jgi:RimJ/RimL family protein N-acetyltransferase